MTANVDVCRTRRKTSLSSHTFLFSISPSHALHFSICIYIYMYIYILYIIYVHTYVYTYTGPGVGTGGRPVVEYKVRESVNNLYTKERRKNLGAWEPDFGGSIPRKLYARFIPTRPFGALWSVSSPLFNVNDVTLENIFNFIQWSDEEREERIENEKYINKGRKRFYFFYFLRGWGGGKAAKYALYVTL